MIRVTKPKACPAILKSKGKKKRRAHSAAFSRSISDYISGDKTFDFDREIYGHRSVKEALIKAQHDKCFLCESKITHIDYGDVEHFRPKAGYSQSRSDTLHRPGYYWLAYEWSNLFLSCALCNQRFKANFFPLSNPGARAESHKDNVDDEDALFIDPSCDDPEQYISFRKEVPFPIDDNPKGEATITYSGLNRQKLNEKRFDWYEALRLIYALATANPPQPETSEAQNFLVKAVQDHAEYASMVRAAINARFTLVS
jgi:uncharacterized protein (TIGR02646 family)